MRENSDFVATVSHNIRCLPAGYVVELDIAGTPRTQSFATVTEALKAGELLAQDHGKTLGINRGQT